MRGPIDDRGDQRTRRRRSSAAAKQRYPAGKALGRIEYFETQRALARTVFAEGRVLSSAAAAPRVSKRALRSPRAGQASLSAYAKANTQKARLTPGFDQSGQLPVWRPLGPSSIPRGQTYGSGGNNTPAVSGRCVGIVVSPTNPQHLVLCSAGGGLWGTLDLGRTWQPLTDQQPTLSMGAMAAAPGSPNIVYAGTGEGDTFSQLGVGLLRSADGGQTWEHVPSADLAGAGIYDIAVDPADAFHVWVGTTDRLLESRDGGTTWRVVQRATTWDVSINPADTQEIFAATAAGLIR
jgi:hypothetical protein